MDVAILDHACLRELVGQSAGFALDVRGIGMPSGFVPDLDPIAHADESDLALQSGALPEMLRQEHATGYIDLDFDQDDHLHFDFDLDDRTIICPLSLTLTYLINRSKVLY